MEIQIKVGLLCVLSLCQKSKLSTIENSIEQLENDNSVPNNEAVELFMKTLDRDIKTKATPPSAKLNHLEHALTLLNDL